MEFDSTKEGKWKLHQVAELSIFVILGLISTIAIPLYFGFTGGFTESFAGKALTIGDVLVNLFLYYIMTILSFGLVVLGIGKIFYLKKGETIIDKVPSKWVAIISFCIIHNPEEDGALYLLFDRSKAFKSNPIKSIINFFRFFVISLLFFIPISLFQASTGNSFVSLPQQAVLQSLTTSQSIFFQVFLPAFSETFVFVLFLSLLMGLLGWGISKLKMESNVKLILFFVLSLLIICPFLGVTWMQFHHQVYGNNDVSSRSTFIFGTSGSAITVISGSSVPWYTWHLTNNLMLALIQYSTVKEDVVFMVMGIYFVILFLYIVAEILAYRYRKKKHKKLEDFDY